MMETLPKSVKRGQILRDPNTGAMKETLPNSLKHGQIL